MDRRDFLKSVGIGSATLALPRCSKVSDQVRGTAPKRKPNIVLFLVDDLGWQDTSVPFHTQRTAFNNRYHTPNMERLAKQGMRFTNAYSASPVCTPTRTSLMTGRNPGRTHITNWILYKDRDQSASHPLVRPPKWNVNGLSPSLNTPQSCCTSLLPQILKENGYRTIHIGKAHFGAKDTTGADPRNLGFDINIAGHAPGGPASYLGRQNYGDPDDPVWNVPGLEAYHGTDTFLTEALTIEANKVIEQAVRDGAPFFVNMAHYAVHVPFAPDTRFYQKYRDKGLDHTEAMYAAMVEGMDASLGSIMDNLEKLDVADNTIVLFFSDNGGLSAAGRGGQKHTHNAPLKSGKGSSYEGGIRVPMIVKWPRVIRGNTTCDTPVISDDFFPTILSMARLTNPQQYTQDIDGKDLAPLLRQMGTFKKDRAICWHYPHQWGGSGPGIEPFSAIRRGNWKLIYYHAGPRFELYNLVEDIGETTDLSKTWQDVVRQLGEQLHKWLIEVGAQMSVDKKTQKPVRLPVVQ